MESDLDSQVPHAFAFGDPLEPHLPAPLPLFVPFAGPNRTRFVPIDFCSGRLAKDVQIIQKKSPLVHILLHKTYKK